MKIKLLSLLICLLMLSSAQAQKYANYAAIDTYVKNLETTRIGDINVLHDLITKTCHNDFEKLRAFYTFMMHHIRYDHPTYRLMMESRKLCLEINAKTALQNRTTVCSGYSYLFKEFCKISNIKCEYIVGYSKGGSYQVGDLIYEANHAWNIVTIGKIKYCIDATWGSCNRTYDWFLTDAKTFLYSHLPLQESHQLLTSPISLYDFNCSLKPDVKFCEAGITEMYPQMCILESDGIVDFQFANASKNARFRVSVGDRFKVKLKNMLPYERRRLIREKVTNTQSSLFGLHKIQLNFKMDGTFLVAFTLFEKGISKGSVQYVVRIKRNTFWRRTFHPSELMSKQSDYKNFDTTLAQPKFMTMPMPEEMENVK